MLICNRLRIDCDDGSSVLDYRIENDRIEFRRLGTNWRQLTPDEISSHVMANSVVAEWLRRRMGLHLLLRACNSSTASPDHDDCRDRIAA